MTVTVGSFSFNKLTAQPLTYQGDDVPAGISAKSWAIEGILTPAEWIALINQYDNWRNAKIQENPAVDTNSVGTTVPLTVRGVGGQQWTNVACWFQDPPQGQQLGAYVAASFTLVDAAEALQVLKKQQKVTAEAEEDTTPDLGNYTLGGVSLKLRKPPDGYTFNPTVEPTANGSHYISGPLNVTFVKNIEGETDQAGWTSIRSWYETIIQSTPAINTWFPFSPPEATAEGRVVNGSKTTVYTVSVTLVYIK